jgi:hypothetical protein
MFGFAKMVTIIVETVVMPVISAVTFSGSSQKILEI